MGRRTLLVIASVLVAAAGTALIWLYVQGADARAQRDWRDLVPVLVATQNIDAGSTRDVIADRTEAKRVPRTLLPDKPIATVAWIGAKRSTVPILAGQFLIEGQFENSNTLSGVQDGRMAIAVNLEDPNRVASLLKPEARVAIYAVATAKGTRTVDLVLPDVRVIAVGGATSALNPKGDPAKVGTQSSVSTALVTLDVTGPDATRLMAHQAGSTLYFTLLGKNAKGETSDNISLLGSGSGSGSND